MMRESIVQSRVNLHRHGEPDASKEQLNSQTIQATTGVFLCANAGIWLKDEGASDMRAYERSLTHCMRLGGLQKETALRLFEGLHISQTGDGISLRYLTVVPFFQVEPVRMWCG